MTAQLSGPPSTAYDGSFTVMTWVYLDKITDLTIILVSETKYSSYGTGKKIKIILQEMQCLMLFKNFVSEKISSISMKTRELYSFSTESVLNFSFFTKRQIIIIKFLKLPKSNNLSFHRHKNLFGL